MKIGKEGKIEPLGKIQSLGVTTEKARSYISTQVALYIVGLQILPVQIGILR